MPGAILIWEQNLPHAIQRIRLVRKVTQFFQKIKNQFLYRHRLSPFPFIPSRPRRGGLPVYLASRFPISRLFSHFSAFQHFSFSAFLFSGTPSPY
jgi:hypothetical protein